MIYLNFDAQRFRYFHSNQVDVFQLCLRVCCVYIKIGFQHPLVEFTMRQSAAHDVSARL
jgi:hypothetical protein